ncbi:pyrroloquinoline quinone biosynthesis protein PqqD [Rhodoplanes elegans]|uniref:Pyrroloquinoline quinone biosynthesis peptide chaperone PqqD n=1 Tax=Rhodoplanes elegans TaxID=29408 RepID=A0A327KRZ1_9BRAD|nr:pyrroloquinoline quinone biosynthesis peptide chaperone PqqD [Rhodoplanes elegans]MBK5957835.1 pyrroloquinoline quinone biosynthesis protein PqqD [Rhodoplanes elegans]RAI40052.1 pyrroloquinoline quinone biosynthesis peptide chaperone PqqD [Rhodoplanes elegans]
MTEERTVPADARPRLARGVRLTSSAAHGGPVLLAPERILKLDPVAADILGRCDGSATMTELVDALASLYQAPRERIAGDVATLLRALADKHLVDL